MQGILKVRRPRLVQQARTRLASGMVVLLAATAILAGSVAASSGYPMTVKGAVATLYAPEKVRLVRVCKQTLFSADGDAYYALAWVRRASGKRSQAAFQFINTAGWFAMWRDGRPTTGVPIRMRRRVQRTVVRLRSECG